MLRRMIVCVIFLGVGARTSLAAEEVGPPTSAGAVKARQEYEAAVEAAKKVYLESLAEATELAEQQNAKAELARLRRWKDLVEASPAVNEHDKLAKVRMKIGGTSWTWNRPNDPNRMTFAKSGEWITTVPQKGLWVMATDRIAIASYRNPKSSRDELFLFEFYDDYTQYSVKAFGDIASKFTSGQKINK